MTSSTPSSEPGALSNRCERGLLEQYEVLLGHTEWRHPHENITQRAKQYSIFTNTFADRCTKKLTVARMQLDSGHQSALSSHVHRL